MWADDLLLKNAFGSRNAQAMSMLDAVKATGELTKRMWISQSIRKEINDNDLNYLI